MGGFRPMICRKEAYRYMREPIKRGDAEISRRIAEKRTDWNLAYLKRTSCPEESEWRVFRGNTRAMTIPIRRSPRQSSGPRSEFKAPWGLDSWRMLTSFAWPTR